jgi:hypothetical protein
VALEIVLLANSAFRIVVLLVNWAFYLGMILIIKATAICSSDLYTAEKSIGSDLDKAIE